MSISLIFLALFSPTFGWGWGPGELVGRGEAGGGFGDRGARGGGAYPLPSRVAGKCRRLSYLGGYEAKKSERYATRCIQWVVGLRKHIGVV